MDLVEAGIEMPSRMPLAEGADHRRVDAEALELPGETLFVKIITEAPAGPLDFWLRGTSPVSDNASLNAEPAGIQRSARRQARCIGSVAIFEDDSIPGNCVDGGACVAMVAVASQVIRAEAVDVYVEESHVRRVPMLF